MFTNVGVKDCFADFTSKLTPDVSTIKLGEQFYDEAKLFDCNPSPSNTSLEKCDFSWSNMNFSNSFDWEKGDSSSDQTKPLLSVHAESEASTIKGSTNKDSKARWRKEDDKVLFHKLRQLCNRHNITREKFIDLFKAHKHPLIIELMGEVGWKCSEASFIHRILKLNRNCRSLSCREKKRLRKDYYNQVRDNNIDWDTLVYEFPGKDFDYIKKTCLSFPRGEKLKERAGCNASKY